MEQTMESRKISVIPAKKRQDKAVRVTEKRLRVAAYCRVSTLMEHQETSYERQVSYYTKLIEENENWTMAGIYADDGITATNTRKRDDFNAMIEDCKKGKIDLVLTKSVSRFARNTVDCLQHIRLLKERNIALFFEKENVNTLDGAGELLITILSSQAQEESRNISENVKWSLRRKYEKGGVHTSRLLGYQKGKDGKLEIIPHEAETVRFIYKEYLEGESVCAIARKLDEKGVPTMRGGKWNTGVIDKILMNEKYMGDVLSQKTFTADFLTKRREVNDGVLPQYYVENNHEAIIPKELFYMAQEERKRRAALRKKVVGKKNKEEKSKHSGKYALTEILICEECGQPYRRQIWSKNGEKKAVWRCNNRLRNGTKYCRHSPTLDEDLLHESILNAVNGVMGNKQDFVHAFRESVLSVLGDLSRETETDYDKEIAALQKKLMQMIQDGENMEEYQKEYQKLCEKIDRLRMQKIESIHRKEKNSRSSCMEDIEGQLRRTPELTRYDDVLTRKLIENIGVSNGSKIEIRFRSGIVIRQMVGC